MWKRDVETVGGGGDVGRMVEGGRGGCETDDWRRREGCGKVVRGTVEGGERRGAGCAKDGEVTEK